MMRTMSTEIGSVIRLYLQWEARSSWSVWLLAS